MLFEKQVRLAVADISKRASSRDLVMVGPVALCDLAPANGLWVRIIYFAHRECGCAGSAFSFGSEAPGVVARMALSTALKRTFREVREFESSLAHVQAVAQQWPGERAEQALREAEAYERGDRRHRLIDGEI